MRVLKSTGWVSWRYLVSWRISWRVLADYLVGVCLMVFSWFYLVFGKKTVQVKCKIHDITGDMNLHHLVRCVSQVLHCKIAIFSLSSLPLKLNHCLVCNFYLHSLEWFRQTITFSMKILKNLLVKPSVPKVFLKASFWENFSKFFLIACLSRSSTSSNARILGN